MAVSFQNDKIKFTLKDKSKIRKWVNAIILGEKKKKGQINFVFTSDETLLEMNKKYLKHDTYTDILTFDYSEGKIIGGDVIISVERVKENAAKFKTNFEEELRRVMIHGILHLCGYKDKTKANSLKMRKQEDLALKIYKFVS